MQTHTMSQLLQKALDPYRNQAMERLLIARDAFHYSAAGYALLTSPETGPEIARHRIHITESGFTITQDDASPGPAGNGYRIRFNAAVQAGLARSTMDAAYARMLSESVAATGDYATAKNEFTQLRDQDWFAFAMHLRNAFSHNNIWNFGKRSKLPVRWRNFTIDAAMAGLPLNDFLPWYHGLQLCAQMILYVEGIVDYRQQRVPCYTQSSTSGAPDTLNASLR